MRPQQFIQFGDALAFGGILGKAFQAARRPQAFALRFKPDADVLKGAGPEAASKFGLLRLAPVGRVIGKRCRTSLKIGAMARKVRCA